MHRVIGMAMVGLLGCTPGTAKQSGDAISDYEWEPGATEPIIQNGEVYCTTGVSGVTLTYINVIANDPQGLSDLKEGEWFAYSLETDELIASDVLYCDGQECIYSYHAEQYPSLPCRQLSEFAFWAVVWDWSGNETTPMQLTVLGEQQD